MATFPSGTITGANVQITLTIPGIFTSPQLLAQFSTDDIFEVDDVEPTEAIMGVDGILSLGYKNVPTPQRFSFQANSPSLGIFDTWDQAQQLANDAFPCFGLVSYPGLGKKFVLNQGGLVGYKRMPSVRKMLDPQPVRIMWQQIIPMQIAGV